MVKLSKQKILIIDKVAKSFTLLNASDKTTVITRDMARAAMIALIVERLLVVTSGPVLETFEIATEVNLRR